MDMMETCINMYVSPLGHDRGDGTKAHPLATLQRAAGQDGTRQVTVYVAAGKYFMAEPLSLDRISRNIVITGQPYQMSVTGHDRFSVSGDVIRAINGTSIVKMAEFCPLYDTLPVGERVCLGVIRNSQAMELVFTKQETERKHT